MMKQKNWIFSYNLFLRWQSNHIIVPWDWIFDEFEGTSFGWVETWYGNKMSPEKWKLTYLFQCNNISLDNNDITTIPSEIGLMINVEILNLGMLDSNPSVWRSECRPFYSHFDNHNFYFIQQQIVPHPFPLKLGRWQIWWICCCMRMLSKSSQVRLGWWQT